MSLSNLSPELLLLIFLEVQRATRGHDLSSLLQVSKRCNAIAHPLLYRDIVLSQYNFACFSRNMEAITDSAADFMLSLTISYDGPPLMRSSYHPPSQPSIEVLEISFSVLSMHLKRMRKLASFSFHANISNLPPVSESCLSMLVSSLPESCVSLELDTLVESVAGPKRFDDRDAWLDSEDVGVGEHSQLSATLNKVVLQLKHLRLSSSIALFLHLIDGHQVKLFPKMETLYISTEHKRGIMAKFPTKLLELYQHNPSVFPSAEEILVLEEQAPLPNEHGWWACTFRDIIRNETRKIPWRTLSIKGAIGNINVARLRPGLGNDIIGWSESINTAVRDQTWASTSLGARLPVKAIISRPNLRLLDLGFETKEEWQRQSRITTPNWTFEDLTGLDCVHGIVQSGITCDVQVRTRIPPGWREKTAVESGCRILRTLRDESHCEIIRDQDDVSWKDMAALERYTNGDSDVDFDVDSDLSTDDDDDSGSDSD